MARKVEGQIFLDSFSPILKDLIAPRLLEGKRESCEFKVSDFDDVMYKVVVPVDALSTLSLSISMVGFAKIMEQGGEELLKSQYGALVAPAAPGYDLTLTVDLEAPPMPAETVLTLLTEVKRNLQGLLLTRAFTSLLKGTASSLPMLTVCWRKSGETVYIVPQTDRVTVIFGVDFPEDDEKALSKVFLMEFADAQRGANNSPPCSFTPEPPLELQGVSMDPRNVPGVGYLTFVIFPQHVEGDRMDKTITLLAGFRTYLHYHIKATKTYMHMRMRKRCVSLLQVLNRAIPDEEKEKKTIQGKTFRRDGSSGSSSTVTA